jgi:aryl-alcohol dehydrogenase-like predicted oxidoreductase
MLWRERQLGPWCLGTAQLGFDYGISNSHGRPNTQEAQAIVGAARDAGVRLFDTATAYGDSQQVLGNCIKSLSLQDEALVVTKLADDELLSEDVLDVLHEARTSCGVPRFFGVLAHSSKVLRNFRNTQKIFYSLKSEGITEYCGISVYDSAEALFALSLDQFDLVQMPLNLLDRAAVDRGVIEEARKRGKLLFFRSALLQGLLTMPADNIPEEMEFANQMISAWSRLCTREKLSQTSLALQIAERLAGGYPLVIGAELAEQVRVNAAALKQVPPNLNELITETASLAEGTTEILRNPSLWPKNKVVAK